MADDKNLKIKELANVKTIVVDDSELQRTLHSKILTQLGIKDISVFNDGTEALAEIESSEEEYGLIVTDWEMPEMDGGILLQRVKKIPKYENIPFLICSGALGEQDIYLAVEFGISNYLVKPFTPEKYHKKLVELFKIGKKKTELDQKLEALKAKMAEEKFKAVLKALQELQKKYAKDSRLQEMMGDCFLRLRDYPAAVKVFRKLSQQFPKNLSILNKLARSLMMNKEINQAVVLMEQLRLLGPKNINRLVDLGDAYLDLDNPEKAEETFNEAKEQDPTNQEVDDGMGKSLFAQGKFSKATQFLQSTEKAAEIASYFNNLGIALVRQKRFEEAKKLYVNALNILPANQKEPQLLFNIGLACKKGNDLPQAASFFKCAVEKGPELQKGVVNLEELFTILD